MGPGEHREGREAQGGLQLCSGGAKLRAPGLGLCGCCWHRGVPASPLPAPGAGLWGLSPCAGLWGELGVQDISMGQWCEVLRLLAPWHHKAGGACVHGCVRALRPLGLSVWWETGGAPCVVLRGCPRVPVSPCARACGAATALPELPRRRSAWAAGAVLPASGSVAMALGAPGPARWLRSWAGAGGRCWVRAEPCRPSVPWGDAQRPVAPIHDPDPLSLGA